MHLGPDGYSLDRLVDELSDVVMFDRASLGDLTGMDLIHLQCHLGTDTVSLARLGASITGLDFSTPAIASARRLADDCGIKARFVEGNVYDAVELLGDTYDIVYTGVGAINWLPDVRRWAQIVAALLKPGGRFHITEGHPVAMVLSDDATPDNMAAIVQAILDAGLVLDTFTEHRDLPWLFMPWMEHSDHEGWYRFPAPLRDSIPLAFTITAHKPVGQ